MVAISRINSVADFEHVVCEAVQTHFDLELNGVADGGYIAAHSHYEIERQLRDAFAAIENLNYVPSILMRCVDDRYSSDRYSKALDSALNKVVRESPNPKFMSYQGLQEAVAITVFVSEVNRMLDLRIATHNRAVRGVPDATDIGLSR